MTIENEKIVAQEDEKFVPKSSYEDVKNDMFKYKEEKKKLEAELKQAQAVLEAEKVNKMKEKEEWKILYEQEQAKRMEVEKTHSDAQKKFIDYHKKNAVIAKIGGFKRDEYNSFIDVSKVEMDENGNIISTTLEAEVNRLKQMYPELIKSADAGVLPSAAPRGFNVNTEKEFSKMSDKEKMDYKLSLLGKK